MPHRIPCPSEHQRLAPSKGKKQILIDRHKLFPSASRLCESVFRGPILCFEKVLQKGAKNLFLALEFPVNQRSRYGCLFGDIFKRTLRIAKFKDAVAGSIEDDPPPCCISLKRFFLHILNRYILYIICNTVTGGEMSFVPHSHIA